MLSPHDIENKTFERAIMGGYKPDDVDQFLDTITEDFKKLYYENTELTKKISVLVDKIDEYRKDEEYLRGAILNAQKLSDLASREATVKTEEIVKDAQKKAEDIINCALKKAEESISIAQKKAEEITGSAEERFNSAKTANEENLKREKEELKRIRHEVSDFRSRLVNMYKSHIELIKSIPTFDKEHIEEIEEKNITEKEEELSEIQVEINEQPKPEINTDTIDIGEIPIMVNASNKDVINPFKKSTKVKIGLDYDISKD